MSAYELWAARADEQLEWALSALRDPDGSVDDVLAGIGLAELAFRIAVGELDAELWPVEPECTCPPELVARGGFKSGCPVHAL